MTVPATRLPVPALTGPPPPDGPFRFALVAAGWRATVFLRLAALAPAHLSVTAVLTRSASRGAEVEATWGVPTVRTTAELVATHPEVVVSLVPREAAPATVRELVDLGLPVLSETPPAADRDGLEALWADVGPGGLVQVAEQYPRYPGHAARLALLGRGVLGDVSDAQVSSTHGYHAMALLRAYLGHRVGAVGGAVGAVGAGGPVGEVAVTAFTSTAPLADPVVRDAWRGDSTPRHAALVRAHLDLGDGRTGLYDFTDNQWHNPLRSRRVVVRGSLGEVVDDRVVRVVDPRTVVTSELVRRQTGVDLDLEGLDLDHVSWQGEVLWRNAWQGARLADDEVAVADLLGATGRWARDEGPPPYPLADACEDHALALAVEESLATGKTVRSRPGPWS